MEFIFPWDISIYDSEDDVDDYGVSVYYISERNTNEKNRGEQ